MVHPIDKSNFRQVVIDFPGQFKKALEFAKGVGVDGEIDRVVVCGVGGSALPVDMVKTYLDSKGIKLSIEACRSYTLPNYADGKTLVIASSYSGNTEETLSCFKEANEKGFPLIGLARGGSKLEKACKENNKLFVEYPDDGPTFQPRLASGYSFTSMMSILMNQGLIPDLSEEIRKLGEALKPEDMEKEGKGLAAKIGKSIPVFYSSDLYEKSVSRICKIKINENSKTQSFFNCFPELNHNEMVGYTRLIGDYHIVIFKDPEDHPRILKRFEITSKLFEEKGLKVDVLEMKGDSTLEKMFNSILLFDWVSYYLALEAEIDPTPVDMVEDLKKMLAE